MRSLSVAAVLKSIESVLDRLRSDGPLTTKDIGGAKASGYWWDWSDSKIAIEWLLDIGTVVVTRREGWRRVYDLADRAVLGTHRHDHQRPDAGDFGAAELAVLQIDVMDDFRDGAQRRVL